MKIERVLLMIPNFRWQNWRENTLWNVFPYNICLLVALIEKDYDVKILDANIDNLSENEFAVAVADFNPDIVGISILTNEYGKSGHIAAEIIKNISKQIKVIMGGVYATNSSVDIMKNGSNVDYVVEREGENVFPNLLTALEKNLPRQVIAGTLVENLDNLPRPAYHKINFLKYANTIPRESVDSPRQLPYARIQTSRGCPVGCNFCEVSFISGKKFRARSPENIVAEMEWLKEKYAIKSILFDDDNMLFDKKRAKDLFKLMADRKLNLTWNAIATAVFLLDEEMLELMVESGCQYLDIAIESGVPRVLKEIIHKPLNFTQAERMAKKARSLGIDLIANFIIGMPGETWAEIRESLNYASNFDADYIKIFIATPLPNTEMYELAREKGYLINGFNFDDIDWSYGKIKTPEFSPHELAILRAYEWDRINFTSPARRAKIAKMMNITEDELNQVRKRTLKEVKYA